MGQLGDNELGELRVFTSPVNDRNVKIHGFTGEVVGEKSYSKTETYSRGMGESLRVRSDTTEGTKFFLKDGDKERDFHFVDCIPVREGNRVSVIWGVAEGKDDGEYAVIKNHTIDKGAFLFKADRSDGIVNSISCSDLGFGHYFFWIVVSLGLLGGFGALKDFNGFLFLLLELGVFLALVVLPSRSVSGKRRRAEEAYRSHVEKVLAIL